MVIDRPSTRHGYLPYLSVSLPVWAKEAYDKVRSQIGCWQLYLRAWDIVKMELQTCPIPSNISCPNCECLPCVCNQLIQPSPSVLSHRLRLRIPLSELRRGGASIIVDSAQAQVRLLSVRNFVRLNSWPVWHNLHQQLAFAVTHSPVSFVVLSCLAPVADCDEMLSAQHWICAVFGNGSQFPKTNQN